MATGCLRRWQDSGSSLHLGAGSLSPVEEAERPGGRRADQRQPLQGSVGPGQSKHSPSAQTVERVPESSLKVCYVSGKCCRTLVLGLLVSQVELPLPWERGGRCSHTLLLPLPLLRGALACLLTPWGGVDESRFLARETAGGELKSQVVLSPRPGLWRPA